MAGGSSSQSGWAAAGLGPGSLVAGYRVESRIGAGGMAMVLRARDEALGRTVALKILPPAFADDPDFRQRFLREARAVAAVDHPHIIPVYAAGEANGVLYLAMRYITGGDLRSVVLREGPLPGDRAVALLSPVASALDAAHRAGLIHRDVKPANILVDTSADRLEHPYLSDFGLAKGAASTGGLTGTGQYLGTPDYSAPEQIAGRQTGPRTDQYALACVAYTILTGSLPFPRDEPMSVLWAHVHEEPPSLTAKRPDLPLAADRVIARALAKAPDDRYATCGQFIDALRTVLDQPVRTSDKTGTSGIKAPPSQAPIWPQRLNQGGQPSSGPTQTAAPRLADPAGRTQSSLPPVFADSPLSALPRDGDAWPSVPPVIAPAGTGVAAPGRARHSRARRWPRFPVVTVSLALVVLLVGGGFFGFWRYAQGQYYIGVSSDGYVAIFRGTNQSLLGISMSSLLSRSTLKASMLSSGDQATLAQTVSVSSRNDGQQRIDQLAVQANQCQAMYRALAAWQTDERAYQAYLAAKTEAARTKTKPPAVVNNPGAMPSQLPDSEQCAPSTAFGIPASALPAAATSAPSATPAVPTASPAPTATATAARSTASAKPTAAG
jgi:serine/threonine protein kinase